MSTRSTGRAWAFAAIALSGGCALAAGYDFGKYTETGGAGGGAGNAASGANNAVSGAGGHVSSSVTASGAGATSASTGATSTATAASSTSGSTVATTVTTTVASASASTTTTVASSSGTGGSVSGTIVTLYDNLLGPEAIAVDNQRVYFTLDNAASTGLSGAGLVGKDGSGPTMFLQGVDRAPAICVGGTGSGAYLVTTTAGVGIVQSYMGSLKVVGTPVHDTMLGVASNGSTVFFTTQGSNTWSVLAGGMPGTFVPNDIAAGPIAADTSGVYFADVAMHMVSAPLGGGTDTVIAGTPAAVYGVATDMTGVYWTDQSGGVYLVEKVPAPPPPTTLSTPDMTPAYGLAVSSAGTLYFAHGTNIEHVSFPWGSPKDLTFGLKNPRGVAADDKYVYVALHGSGTAPDGSIIRITQ